MRNNPARRAPGTGTQIEVERTDGGAFKKYKCSRCVIYYETVESTPACPLCAQEIRTEQMRQALSNATAKIDMLERQNNELAGASSITHAMKDASALLGDDDRTFLKGVLYEWRETRAVTLKIHRTEDGKVAGFLADYRGRDVEAYTCTSMGGKALAGYYQEAASSSGSAKAIETLMHALQHLLQGGT